MFIMPKQSRPPQHLVAGHLLSVSVPMEEYRKRGKRRDVRPNPASSIHSNDVRAGTPMPPHAHATREYQRPDRTGARFNPHSKLKSMNTVGPLLRARPRPLPGDLRRDQQKSSSLPATRSAQAARPASFNSLPPHPQKPQPVQPIHVTGPLQNSEPGALVTIGTDIRTVDEVQQAIKELNAEEKSDESLPAPWHETEMKIAAYLRKKDKLSNPMELPTKGQKPMKCHIPVSNSQDTSYLERLYALRTWNMYNLISDARSDSAYQPSPPRSDDGDQDSDGYLDHSDGHCMVFEME